MTTAATTLVALTALALALPAAAHAQPALGSNAPRPETPVCAGARDFGSVRWDAAGGVIPVWIQRRPAALGDGQHFAVEFDRAVAQGLAAWAGAVPGMRLVRVADSASADVRVVWRRTLGPASARGAAAVAGRTSLDAAADGHIASALVELAARDAREMPFRPSDVAAVAQHEFAHALGLAHRADGGPPRHDRDALRALYAADASGRGSCGVAHR
jgi:hypothetical protein